MTKKDYKTLAACLGLAYAHGFSKSKAKAETWHEAVMDVIKRIVIELQLDNPKFDRDLFLAEVDRISRLNS